MVRVFAAAALIAGVVAQGAAAQRVSAPGGFVPQQALAFGARGADATAVDASNPLPVAPVSVAVTYVDRSGAIAVGGVAQVVAPVRTTRRGFFLQNLSAGDVWIGIGTPATIGAPAIRLAAGQLYESPASGVPADAISIVGATAGQTFTTKEW